MDERAALNRLADRLPHAGDDCAAVDGALLTTDMLHERTDFPPGTTRYTAGWRAVGASLSDLAGSGAAATAAVAVYAAPAFEADELDAFVDGARDVCEFVDAAYVGGDLDSHDEFTVASTALGHSDDPVRRDGAAPGEAVCVTGSLGRTAAALRCFEAGDHDRGNDLFQFHPRVAAGRALAPYATAMLDSSDGLARSCHQLAAASECGIAIERDAVPIHQALRERTDDAEAAWEAAAFTGEDFELVCTIPTDAVDDAIADCPVPLTRIGETVAADSGADGEAASDTPPVTVDGAPLPDRGYDHGE
jgi:thiamine-monophosphate kinase